LIRSYPANNPQYAFRETLNGVSLLIRELPDGKAAASMAFSTSSEFLAVATVYMKVP
jgi:hypothetical protein